MENKIDKPDQPTDIFFNHDATATWVLDAEGDVTASTYRGSFTFKCYLDPMTTLATGRLFRELLGPNPNAASEDDKFLAYTLSQLNKRIVKAPPFWSTAQESGFQGNLPDLNVLLLILGASVDAEKFYKTKLKLKRDAALEKARIAAEALKTSLMGDKKPTKEDLP